MRLVLTFLFIGSFVACTYAQDRQKITFVPVFNGQKVELNSSIKGEDGSWIEISTLRFYISHLNFSGPEIKWLDPSASHLIDLEDSLTLVIETETMKTDTLSFLMGIDSLTNVSGILDGDLDPIKGMYWTWNSGYINFKLEGRSSNFTGNNSAFEYHIGGYLPPYTTARQVDLPISKSTPNIYIEIELSNLLHSELLKSKNEIMIPGKDASAVSEILPSLFKIVSDEK